MTTTITPSQYWREIADLAADISAEAKAEQRTIGEVLHEWIDGHKWVIYYANNLPVLQHTSNPEALIDAVGAEAAGHELKVGGLTGLHTALAYFAITEDVQNHAEFVDWEWE